MKFVSEFSTSWAADWIIGCYLFVLFLLLRVVVSTVLLFWGEQFKRRWSLGIYLNLWQPLSMAYGKIWKCKLGTHTLNYDLQFCSLTICISLWAEPPPSLLCFFDIIKDSTRDIFSLVFFPLLNNVFHTDWHISEESENMQWIKNIRI